MSEILSLGEVVRPTRPRVKPETMPNAPFIGMEHVEAHTMKLLGTVPAGTMKSSAVHFKPGDVLYGRLRPYLDKVFRPSFEGLCSAEFIVLPESEYIDGSYLQYFLNSSSFVRFAVSLNAGDRPRVDFDQIAPYKIPLPSLKRQREIVDEIEKQFSRLDEAVANLQRVKANLKRYKASVLKAAVEGRLVNGDTAVEQAHDKSKWLPISLAIKSLDQGWSPKCENEPRTDVQEWAVMRTTAVQEMQFLPDENKRLPMGLEPRSQLELMKGDLLITRAGPRNRVGITCLVKATSSRLMLCDKAYRLRINLNLALPAYLEVVLNSPTLIDILDEMKSGISDSGLNLTQKRFSELLVPLPSLSAQAEIVAEVDRHLSIAREVEADVDINLKRAQALRHATLRSAFNRVEVG